jgi:transposase InsO family protein
MAEASSSLWRGERMALRVVSMAELRRDVLLQPERTGESVAEICRRFGISRQTWYRYRRRYLAEGLDGLEDRSREPLRSPGRMDPELELEICRMRKDHWRWGARRIHTELERKGVAPPAVSTIHRVLVRNHLVALQPPRRPKALKRFEREISNDLWQIDATRVRLANKRIAWILDMIDDHSRYLLAAVAVWSPTGEAAWDCFELAANRYGLPRQVLSDNALSFTGRLHGVEVEFERSLKELGVELINSGPYHPETLGKLERFHKTLKQWLADEGPAHDLDHLQELLDGFRHHYNRERPHQAIGNLTPAERFKFTPPVAEAISTGVDVNGEPVYPPRSLVRKVSKVGNIGYLGVQITIGKRWAYGRVRVLPLGGLVHIYYGEELIRVIAIEPGARYAPMGKGVAKPRPVT